MMAMKWSFKPGGSGITKRSRTLQKKYEPNVKEKFQVVKTAPPGVIKGAVPAVAEPAERAPADASAPAAVALGSNEDAAATLLSLCGGGNARCPPHRPPAAAPPLAPQPSAASTECCEHEAREVMLRDVEHYEVRPDGAIALRDAKGAYLGLITKVAPPAVRTSTTAAAAAMPKAGGAEVGSSSKLSPARQRDLASPVLSPHALLPAPFPSSHHPAGLASPPTSPSNDAHLSMPAPFPPPLAMTRHPSFGVVELPCVGAIPIAAARPPLLIPVLPAIAAPATRTFSSGSFVEPRPNPSVCKKASKKERAPFKWKALKVPQGAEADRA